jgi:hypothetical protein
MDFPNKRTLATTEDTSQKFKRSFAHVEGNWPSHIYFKGFKLHTIYF